jgi:hypothetical protein
MQNFRRLLFLTAIGILGISCGAPAGNTNLSAVNTNANVSNSLANSNLNTAGSVPGTTVNAREPDQYQANIKLSLQGLGGSQPAALPPLMATVARSGNDRMMQFTLPTNEKVIYLDKGGMSYLILPSRKQYAELTQDALGFNVRQLMMPAEIVNRVKAMPGVKLVGEETMDGRQVLKYGYEATANTQTQAGNVNTESYILVDKETGLPLHTETVSQSQSGANVQGMNGMRMVTEMTDIDTTPDPSLFNLPTDYAKIDPQQVKAQANLIFQAAAAFLGQMINQAQTNANTSANVNANHGMTTPTASPVR